MSVAAVVPLLLSMLLVGPAAALPEMPAPSYENTFYVFVYDAPLWLDADYAASRDALLAHATSGPYARVGFTTYYPIDLAWNADLSSPALITPSREGLESLLGRLESDGLVYHVSAMLGMSRFFWMYEPAKHEDRRNAQWFLDNLIVPPEVAVRRAPKQAWVTPSRYARKLRRHLEAKSRAFAAMFVELRAAHPETLISASGDAEAELSEARVNQSQPYDEQIIADYSPFAVLEFRDWLLRTGLYADGAPFAGQGYKRKRGQRFAQGVNALTPENLARFNKAFGTAFASWDLEYFHWSLEDPIDGDPGAIKYKKYSKRTFAPLPASGPSHVAGGFDAPRAELDPHKKWWKVWKKFRQKMVASFARDVAAWITTTPGANGEPVLSPDRWYTHQIPADYLNGRQPGMDPLPRLHTSASTLGTAFLPPSVGSPGLTILDRFEVGDFGPSGGYNRTSQYALDAIEAAGVANWGIPEYAPSWPIDLVPDDDVDRIEAQWHRVHAAGAHIAGFTPWPHYTETVNGEALGAFLAEVSDAPRAPSYAPVTRAAFVAQLHVDLLGRAASPAELAARLDAIADGSVSRPRLVADLIASTESRETVAPLVRYYLGLLGREPGLVEFAEQVAVLANGPCTSMCRQERRLAIVAAMAATAEFQSRFGGANPTTDVFVTKLFESILSRTPTAGEKAPWIALIDGPAGFTRTKAAQLFVEGGEYATVSDPDVAVILTYLGTLDRMPTTEERSEWRARLVAGLSKRGLAQTFLISPEYRARFAG